MQQRPDPRPPFYLMAPGPSGTDFVIAIGNSPAEVLGGIAAVRCEWIVVDGVGQLCDASFDVNEQVDAAPNVTKEEKE